MGFLSRLSRIFARSTADPRYPAQSRVPYSPRTLAGVVVTPDTAITVPTVWACLRVVSQTVAVLPWRVKLKTANGRDDAASHPIDYLIGTEPNPEWTSFQFRETLTHWALRWGNGYAEIERDNLNRATALWPLHPERVDLRRGPSADNPTRPPNALYYRVANGSQSDAVAVGGAWVEIEAADMFHLRGFGEGPVGVNVMHYAAESIGWAKAAQLFGAAFLGNGMNVASVIESDKKIEEPVMKRVKAAMAVLYKGVRAAGKTLFLDVGMKFKPIAIDPDKGQFIATNQHLVEEICRWFGVPPHKVMHLQRCMPGDTLVFTDRGPKRIAEVKPGETVWSAGPNGVVRSRVLNNWENGVDEILEISTTNRRFRCNPKHRVLVRRAAERSLAPGETGGRNVAGQKLRLEWRNEYIPAGWLREGDVLISIDRIPDSSVATAPNGRTLTPDFMALCGLMLADGNVTKSRGQPVGIQIARGDQAAYMEVYRATMRREFAGMRARRARVAGILTEAADAPVVLTEGGRSTKLKSVAVGAEMDALGFSGTARTKRVPGWVFTLSEELRLAFLRGFLDGDGTVNAKGRIAFDSCNSALIEDLRHLCMTAGVPVTNVQTHVQVTRPPNAKAPVTTAMFRFTCSDPAQNARIGSHDPRYVARIAAGAPFRRKGRAYPRSGGRSFGVAGLGLSKVVGIARLPAEPVFDIEVEGTHCFFANGVLVSNSTNNNIEHQGIEFAVDTMTPWVRRWEQEANRKLFGFNRRGYYTNMNMNALMRADAAARAAFYTTMFQTGAFSPNKILELEDENTLGAIGDKHLVQLNLTTLDKVGEAAPAPPPAPNAAPPAEDPAAAAARAAFEELIAA